MRRGLYFIVVAIAALVSVESAQAQGSQQNRDFELGRSIEILANIMHTFDEHFVSELSVDDMLKAAVFGLMRITDPFSAYYSEEDMVGFDIATTGKYGGVGSAISKKGDYIVFAEPYKGSPADLAGIKAGDKILAIDGKDMKGVATDVVSKGLKGDPGTDVEVKVERFFGSKIETITIRRSRISIPSVPYTGMLRDGVGYISHDDFIEGSYDEVRRALEALHAQGELRGLVLDYRSNGGGVVTEAVNIASLFVDRGERVVSMMGRDSSSLRIQETTHAPIARDLPIVILVDSNTASSSEILAGALQDMDRAVVMGQRTYGKGLVQATIPAGYNSYVKVTTDKYYTPSGRCIHAHDYVARYNGDSGEVPDSLITEFKTRGGRKVYDGGGIMPDVKIEPKYWSHFAVAVYREGHISDWVDEYVLKHRDLKVDVRSFKLLDSDYADFCRFIEDKEVPYESETRAALRTLEEALENDLYDEALRDDFRRFSALIKDDKMSNMQTYRREIEELLVTEILTRYAYREAAVEYKVFNDPEVERAVELLLNTEEYNRILREQDLSKR